MTYVSYPVSFKEQSEVEVGNIPKVDTVKNPYITTKKLRTFRLNFIVMHHLNKIFSSLNIE